MHDGGGAGAPDVVRESDAGALDLAVAGGATQVPHDLAHLRDAGGAGRVTARLQAAGRVDDELAPVRGAAVGGGLATFALLDEAEVLDGQDLADGVGVMNLRELDVRRADPRLEV